MDVLKPGYGHRSSSDRLLSNYLDSQKSVSTSLLNLLANGHASTSSLLAYVTSSPGVLTPVRRSVRHAAFEGPLSASLLERHGGSQLGSSNGGPETQGWATYVGSLEQFRKDLKQIQLLEEEMSRVRRDREILVSRLIKTTKSRPTKSDLSAIASSYGSRPDGPMLSSRSSVLSVSSQGSTTSKEGKRATKLAGAQAELLGCEEHLRTLEVRIETERNNVMLRGLEERFRAMDAVGRMWISQAKRGLGDLEKAQNLPPDAFEVDSNPSIAPSQSASQTAFDDLPGASPHRPYPRGIGHFQGPGSITGSIAEEEETGSSGDEIPPGQLVVHENRAGATSPAMRSNLTMTRSTAPTRPSPLGVPSVNTIVRPSSAIGQSTGGRGRRAASDVGGNYRPPASRLSMRRTTSNEGPGRNSPTPGSDAGSIGGKKKKKGFLASISRFFKPREGGSARGGRSSPPYGSGSSKGRWQTRTDDNIKRSSSAYGSRSRRGDDSSSDEESNLVSVTNNRASTFSVEDIGRGSLQRSSSTPVASGLIPVKSARSDAGLQRNGSQSTLTGARPATSLRAQSPTTGALPGRDTPASQMVPRPMSQASTVRSTGSVTTAKSTGTAKKRIRQNGSISRATMGSQQAAQGRNIMSLVDAQPVMPEIPKAPRSQLNPQMELARAPSSSLVRPSQPTTTAVPAAKAAPVAKARSNEPAQVKPPTPAPQRTTALRSTTPLPPSRTLQAPTKSALRPTSPEMSLGAPLAFPAQPMFSVTAPGPVELPRQEPAPSVPQSFASVPAPGLSKPRGPIKRGSYQSQNTSGGSVYESAVDGDDYGHGESGSETEEDVGGYDVVENDKVARRTEIAQAGPGNDNQSEASDDTATRRDPMPATGLKADTASEYRRKSVRMDVPDSPVDVMAPRPMVAQPEIDRAPSPEHERADAQWDTRIGRMREDTSDESEVDDGYRRARKGLIKNSGQWEAVKEKTAGMKKTGSVKSKGSKRSTGAR